MHEDIRATGLQDTPPQKNCGAQQKAAWINKMAKEFK